MNKEQATIIEMYLDYFNNFMTLSVFADHYGISERFANEVIIEGKKLHEIGVDIYK